MRLHNISLNNLRRRKLKMALFVLGLAISVSTVVTLVTVSSVMNAHIANTLDEFGANIIIVPTSDDLSLTYGGLAVSGVSFDLRKLSQKDVEQIRSIKNKENIKIISPKLLSAAKIMQRDVLVVGVDFAQELLLKKWWKLSGRRPSTEREAVIGAEIMEKLHLVVSQSFEIRGKKFTVSGILQPTGSQDDAIVFIDLGEAQRLFGKPAELNLIEVAALCYDCPIEEIVRQTSEKLPGAKVTAIRQTIESKMEAMERFEHFSYGVSAVMLLIAGLIVMTNMIASVNERAREIGIFRAIGFRQTHIMRIILMEACLTSFAAGLSGYLLGLGVSRIAAPILDKNLNALPSVDYLLLVLSVLLAVLIGLVSSIYPAYKAARLDPTIALKSL